MGLNWRGIFPTGTHILRNILKLEKFINANVTETNISAYGRVDDIKDTI